LLIKVCLLALIEAFVEAPKNVISAVLYMIFLERLPKAGNSY